MPVKTTCPACQTPYTLAAAMRGKKVRCKQCQEIFAVPQAADRAIQVQPSPAARSAVPPGGRAGAARPALDDPDEDSGARHLPRRRGHGSAERPQSNALMWLLLASGGGVLLIAGIVVTIILVARSSSDEPAPFVPPGPVAQQIPPINFPNVNGPRPPGQLPVIPNPGQNPFPQNPPPVQAPALLKPASTRFAIEPQDNQVQDMFFAPQAGQVACYHADRQDIFSKRLTLHDIKTGQRSCILELGKDLSAGYLDISPDATRAARIHNAGFEGNSLTIWSLPDGKILYEKWNPYPKLDDPRLALQNLSRKLFWFAFLDRDRLLTVAQNGQYDLFNMTQRTTIYSRPPAQGTSRILEYDHFANRAKTVAISLDRKILAMSNKNGFDLIDTATGNVLRRTPPLDAVGKVGNEWSVAFSPDGTQLAARLNLFGAGNKQQEYVLVWDVATGQQKAMFQLAQDFRYTGPLIWWGGRHLLLCNSNWNEGQLFSLADGRIWRICQRSGLGKLASGSPDGRLWCATSAAAFRAAEISAVELPEDQLQQPPAQGQQPPRWHIRPEGVAP